MNRLRTMGALPAAWCLLSALVTAAAVADGRSLAPGHPRTTLRLRGMARHPQTPPRRVAYRVCGRYFESNASGLKGRTSYLAFTTRRAFDKIFGAAPVMGGNAFLPDDAFRSGLVVAVVKRGVVVWDYTVERVTADRGALRVRYRAVSRTGGGATFASPLILAVGKRDLASVHFVENGKTAAVVTVAE